MPADFEMPFTLDVQGPNLHEYFGLWMIEERFFTSTVSRYEGFNLEAHIKSVDQEKLRQETFGAEQASGGRYGYQNVGGVAVINLHGTLMKQVSSMEDGTSTVVARRQVRNAARDPEVSAVLLHIDSPGGTVAGTYDLVDDVRELAKKKKTYAFIEDLGASAAYAVASQANKIFTNKTGMVGSIGTFAVLQDMSQMAENLGVKVHVVRAGDFKGAGVPGTEITDEHLAEAQERVNKLNEHFIRVVSEGRKLSMKRTRELADGRIHIGEDAVELSLADGVQSLEETFAQLEKAASKARRKTMAATLQELKQISGVQSLSNPDKFVLQQLEAGASVEQATAALVQELALEKEAATESAQVAAETARAEAEKSLADLQARMHAEREAINKEMEELRQQAEIRTSSVGIRFEEQTGDEATASSDPITEWNDLVAKHMQTTKDSAKAVSKAHRENPDLHRQFVQAYNLENGRQAQIRF